MHDSVTILGAAGVMAGKLVIVNSTLDTLLETLCSNDHASLISK